MPLLHVLILAAIQGITEFLPISSSGHLVLAWHGFDLLGWEMAEDSESERLILDIAVHVGTLFAVLIYFRGDIARMLGGALALSRGDQKAAGSRLLLQVILATLPLVLAGLLLKDFITLFLRTPTIVALATIAFGILLHYSDRKGDSEQTLEALGYRGALLIGLAQVLSLIPGTSRSGVTMTAARFLGFKRTEAARFSLLLAVPAIFGAGVLGSFDLYQANDLRLGLDAAIAAVFAFLAALVAIWLMMRWLAIASFAPFVAYRLWLGVVLLYLIYQEPIHAALGLAA